MKMIMINKLQQPNYECLNLFFVIGNYAYPKFGYWAQPFTWAHNLFVLWALSFLLWVILCSETQCTPDSSNPPPFTSRSHSLFLLVWSLFFSPDFPTSSSPLIPLFMALDKWRCYDYSPLLMRMGVQFHHLYVSVQVGKVVVALELIPTPKSLLGSDIP